MSATPARAVTRASEIVGAAHFLADPEQLGAYEVDGMRPVAAARPGTADEVAELVRFAAAEKLALIPTGGRSKLRIGAPPRRYDLALDLTRLDRVVAYDAGDLTLSVEAGVRVSPLLDLLAEKGQFLPLLVPFFDRATIGGILAANSGSPLRQFYGSARDFVLGLEFVTGEGTRAKSGGRVVKNVAGYDLHKLMLGSLGTLGILTLANFKTFPLPRAQATFVAAFPGAEGALALRWLIAHSPLSPHTLEILSPAMAALLDPEHLHLPAGVWSLATAAAGHERVVERHAREVSRLAQEAGAASFATLGMEEKSFLWGRIREFPQAVTQAAPAAALLKISALPANFATLLAQAEQVAERYALPVATLVRAVGIVYLALMPPAKDEATLRRLAQASTELLHAGTSAGGAVIEWCPTELKREVNVWGPSREDLPLMQRLKKVFDPHGIFSPGRFLGGI